MIFGNLKYLDSCYTENKYLQKFIEFIKVNDLSKLSKGVYNIDYNNFFVNIVEYNSKDEKSGFWEAHKKYLDVHFMINGCERIKLNFIDNMIQGDYKEGDDFVHIKTGSGNCYVDLYEGDFLVCYPHDVHMTAIRVKDSVYVKKAIFKIKFEK